MNMSPTREAKKHILIADDEGEIRQALRTLLQSSFRNIVIVEAANGSEAALKISREKFDLVILDLMMPKIRGEGVLNGLRGVPRHLWPENVVILSGNIEDLTAIDLPIKLRKLSKPCPVNILLETVSSILDPATPKGRDLEAAVNAALLESVQKSFHFLHDAKLASTISLERAKQCTLLLSWTTEDKRAQFSVSVDAKAQIALEAVPGFPGLAAFARFLLDDLQQRLAAKHIFGVGEHEATLTGPGHQLFFDNSGPKLLWKLQNSEAEVGIEAHFKNKMMPKAA